MLRAEPPARTVLSGRLTVLGVGTRTVLSVGIMAALSGRTVCSQGGLFARQLPRTSLQRSACTGGVTDGGCRGQVIQAPVLLL